MSTRGRPMLNQPKPKRCRCGCGCSQDSITVHTQFRQKVPLCRTCLHGVMHSNPGHPIKKER